MREQGDYRPDTEVKGEWLGWYLALRPHLIFDDRSKSVGFLAGAGYNLLSGGPARLLTGGIMSQGKECSSETDPQASVIAKLGALGSYDNEAIHPEADDGLLEFLAAIGYEDVADAWRDASKRCGGFWYA